jgi:single-strand DNA-binding protein
MNSVQIIGNISNDILLEATPTGKFVAKFNVAINNPFNREKTVFMPIEIWGKPAENTSQYCKKGSKVGIVGYFDVDKWEQNGQNRYKTKIVANSIEFLTPKGEGQQQQSQQQRQEPQRNNFNDDPFADGTPLDISDDMLPF